MQFSRCLLEFDTLFDGFQGIGESHTYFVRKLNGSVVNQDAQWISCVSAVESCSIAGLGESGQRHDWL